MPGAKPLPTCPTCGSDGHSNNVCVYRPSAREIALEAALHTIATETWNIQYEPAQLRQTLQFASRLHDVARRAVDPPVMKGNHAADD